MSKTWLLLDCNYLCYRALYSTGQLSYGGVATGVLYGFLRDIVQFQDLHATERLVFAWDHGKPLRKKVLPCYKAKRHQHRTDEEWQRWDEMQGQVRKLKEELLLELGFRNVFYEKGYEADDIIASCCQSIAKDDSAIIISSDHDLYQLLDTSRDIWMWNPANKTAYHAGSLKRDFGVEPAQWHCVKAIAGCSTDEVPGVEGVGELTAAKFLRGLVPKDSKTYEKIVAAESIWKRNLELIKLPWPGTPSYTLQEDRIDRHAWEKITTKLGMRSISKPPRSIRSLF